MYNNFYWLAMSYSGIRTFIYFIVIFACTFSPISVAADSERFVLDESLSKTNLENIDIENDEICPDEPLFPNEPDESIFSFFDSPREYVSSTVEAMARNMDEYFVDDKIFYDSSGSYLSLRGSVIFNDGGKVRFTSNIRFKLRLPNTEKKFKLFFETKSDKQPYNVSTNSENVPSSQASEGDAVFGIQADSGEGFGWKYKPTLGANVDSGIDVFAKFKFSREHEFAKSSIKWNETPYWYNSIGWGFDSYLELNRKLDDDSLFRSSTFAGWKDNTDQFDLSQVFSFFHTINKKKAVSHYIGVYGESEPIINTTQYLLGIIYRENFHKDYLFFEIEPQIKYQKINRFHPEHSIVFRLEMLFKK